MTDTNSPASHSTGQRAPQGAVALISMPLRIGILITLLITLGGVAWACLARIPIYVNGIAYLLRLGNIGGLRALIDGQIYYQFSASHLVQKPLFRQLYQLSENSDVISDDDAIRITRDLLRSRASGPSLEVPSPYAGLVPQGQVLAWIDSPTARNSLEQKLQIYEQTQRELTSQRREIKALNARITARIRILDKQLNSESDYLRSIQNLQKIGYASRANILAQQTRVDAIQADILSQREEITANAQKDTETIADLQKALVDLRSELDDFIDTSFVFAASPLYIIDLNIPQAGQVNSQDTILHVSNQKLSRLPDHIPGYLSQSDAEQVFRGMPVLVTPVGMDRAQFGGILGTVANVSRLPSNIDQIAERSGSLAIAQEVTALIPDPVRVDLILKRNPDDPEPNHGGFRWSSPGSPPFRLSPGNQLSLQITAQRVRPISPLIPFLMRATGASPPTMPLQKHRSPAAATTPATP